MSDFIMELLGYVLIPFLMLRKAVPLALGVLVVFWAGSLIVSARLPSRKVVLGDVLTALVGLLGLVVAFSLHIYIPYNPTKSAESPDGRYRVEVENRPDFPLVALFDEPSDVRLTLVDNKSQERLQRLTLTIDELSDVIDSRIVWSQSEVTVDFGRGVTRTLPFDSTPR